ncbi:DNA recombination protein RmuC [bacterium]|nr:DNA recombination protein RmuC [bacterium]
MITLLVILIIFLVLGAILAFFYFNKRFEKFEKDVIKSQGVLMLQDQMGEIRNSIQSQSGQNIKIIQDVMEKLSKLDKTNEKIVDFGGQLQDLQNILKNPKHRGILGEYCLEMVLKNVLPPNIYKMQYNLGKDEQTNNDLIVDAAVFIQEKIIPIDAKFSLENYNRLIKENDTSKRQRLEKLFRQDLKNRINETFKYINPSKNTFDFAFMFIPSEAIYYDLLVGQVGVIKSDAPSLIEYAFREKHVIIVSPTTFLAYLQMVLQGLRSLQIEDSAKEIQKNVEKLMKHISSYDVFLQKLGQNLSATVNTYNTTYKEFQKMDKDILKITGDKAGVDPSSVGKPKLTD